MGESVFLVHLKIKCSLSANELHDKAAANGILVFPIHKRGKKEEAYAHIALSCCEVPAEQFPDAVKKLSVGKYPSSFFKPNISFAKTSISKTVDNGDILIDISPPEEAKSSTVLPTSRPAVTGLKCLLKAILL